MGSNIVVRSKVVECSSRNILRRTTTVVDQSEAHNYGGSGQRITKLVLRAPIIRWLGRHGFGVNPPTKWCKTRHVTVSTVVVPDDEDLLGGPFFEVMAFPGHGTQFNHPWGAGVCLYETRVFPQRLGWDTMKIMEAIRQAEETVIRRVSRGDNRLWNW